MEPQRADAMTTQQEAALAAFATRVRQNSARLGLVSSGMLTDLKAALLQPCLVFARLAPFHEPPLSIVDLGSGGGFPGIPLAIARPEHALLLVDSQQKKCDFLRRVVEELELPNVRVLHARVEKIRQLEPPAIFTARFFKDLRTIAAWTRHWRQPDTRYLLFSGTQELIIKDLYNVSFVASYQLTDDKVALEYLTV